MIRGRGPRVAKARAAGVWPGRWRQDLPLKYAEYFAVYVFKSRFVIETKENLEALRGRAYANAKAATIRVIYEEEKQIQRMKGRLLTLNRRRAISLKDVN